MVSSKKKIVPTSLGHISIGLLVWFKPVLKIKIAYLFLFICKINAN